MLIKFIKWFRGYLYVIMKGHSPERFINLCRNHNILLWDLCKEEEGYSFFISLKGFFLLRPIVRKTHTRPIIKKRIGFPFQFQRGKKRKAFGLGIILFITLIYLLSLFVWDISMEGQLEHTEEEIMKFLKEIQVYPGLQKKLIDCQNIEEAIRNKYTDIGWVSAELKGTKLHIRMVETNMPVPYVAATQPCHIVASHDGVIVSIVTRNGTPMVKKGDPVKKGDILISGMIEIVGDGDVLLKKEPVIADGDIILETSYSYNKSFSMQYKKKNFTGEKKSIFGISLFQKKLFLQNPLNQFKKFESCDIIINEKNLKLNHSFILPFSWLKKEYQEYYVTENIYSADEAKEIALERLNLYTNQLEQENVVIQKNNVFITVNKSTCTAKGNLIVWEPAKEQRKIKEEEWRDTDSDELDRDDSGYSNGT